MGGRAWQDHENEQIKRLAEQGLTLIENMHLLPGRTHDAAKCQASRLGISLTEAEAWSKEDRKILRAIYAGKESIKAEVRRLLPHRGYGAARREARLLGIAGSKGRAGRSGYSWVFAAIEIALEDGRKLTSNQLIAVTGASKNAVNTVLRNNHGKKIRIGDWTRENKVGNFSGLWELGAGPDAPKPPKKSSTAACRDFRARKRALAGHFDPFAGLVQQVTA